MSLRMVERPAVIFLVRVMSSDTVMGFWGAGVGDWVGCGGDGDGGSGISSGGGVEVGV